MIKICKKITCFLLIVFVLLILCLQLPFVQKNILNKAAVFLQTTHNVTLKVDEMGGIWPFTFKAGKIIVGTNNITSDLKTVFISLDIWSTFTFRPKINFIQIKESLFTVDHVNKLEEQEQADPEQMIENMLMLIKQTYIKRIEMDHIQVKGFETCVLACRYTPIKNGSHFTLAPVGYSSLIDAQIRHKDGFAIATFDYDTKNVSCVQNMVDSVFSSVPKSVQQYAEKLKNLSLVLKMKNFNMPSLTADFKAQANFSDGEVNVTAAIQDGQSYKIEAYNTADFTLPVFGKLESMSFAGFLAKKHTLEIDHLSVHASLLNVNLSGTAQSSATDSFMSMLTTVDQAKGALSLSGPIVKKYLNIDSCQIDLKTKRVEDRIESEILLPEEMWHSTMLNKVVMAKQPIKIIYDKGVKAEFKLNYNNLFTLNTNEDFSQNTITLKSGHEESLFENSSISIGIQNNTISINGSIMPRGDNKIKIDLLTDEQFREFNGKINVDIKDMAPITTLFDFATVGHLEGGVHFNKYAPQSKKGKINVDLRSKYFNSPRSKTELVTIKGDLNGNGDLNFTQTIEQLAIGKLFIAQTGDVSLKGNIFNNIFFSVKANSHKIGYLSSPVRIDVQGRFNAEKNEADLNVFHIEHLKKKLHLQSPVSINLSPLKITNGVLQSDGGDISFQNIVHHIKGNSQKWTGLIKVSNLPVGIINWFLYKTLLVGKLNGEISLFGTDSLPNVKASISGKGLQWGQLNVFAPGVEETLDCDFQVMKKADHVEWKAKILGKNMADFMADGSFFISKIKEKPIHASMKGYFDLALISAIVATGDRLSGKIDCQLGLSGNVLNPMLNGDIRTENAYVELAEFGTVISKINAHLKAQGTKINIQSLFATDEPLVIPGKRWNTGHLKMSGFIDFKNLLEPYVNMNFIVRNFLLVNSDSIVGTGSGDLKIQGEGIYSRITGHADIEKIAINLNEIDTSDDIPLIHLKDPKKRKYAKEYQKEHNLVNEREILPLDLTLKTHGKLAIHGNIIRHSVWEGEMGVVGPIAEPSLDGKLFLKSGVLDFFGSSLKIDSAHVAFSKQKRNDVWLLMTAGKTVRDVELKMIIDTNQDAPVSFKSSPSYAQDEVLSLMLFGKLAGSVSAGQSIQLAAALGRLKGKKGFNIMDDIRKGFGFDTFEITEQIDSNAVVGDNSATNHAVRIGKKITDNTEILVEQGAAQGTSKLAIETAITDNLSFEAALAAQRKSNNNSEYEEASTASSAGFVWSKRY